MVENGESTIFSPKLGDDFFPKPMAFLVKERQSIICKHFKHFLTGGGKGS